MNSMDDSVAVDNASSSANFSHIVGDAADRVAKSITDRAKKN